MTFLMADLERLDRSSAEAARKALEVVWEVTSGPEPGRIDRRRSDRFLAAAEKPVMQAAGAVVVWGLLRRCFLIGGREVAFAHLDRAEGGVGANAGMPLR
jgi:hypothetical protein